MLRAPGHECTRIILFDYVEGSRKHDYDRVV
jgi:hypothetical protein